MIDFLRSAFSPGNFEPHGVHFVDAPLAMWLIVVGNAISFLAYFFIPIVILYVARNRKDLIFNWMVLLFGLFIFLCGTTHLMHALIFWYPAYRFQLAIDIATALVSFAVAIMFFFVVRIVVKLTSPKQMEDANEKLASEIRNRGRSETELVDRTKELAKVNSEIAVKNDDLLRMNKFMVGRESVIAELAKEIEMLRKKSII